MMKMHSVFIAFLVMLFSHPALAQNNAQVRVAHLSSDAPNVDIWVDGNLVLENVPFKAVSNYLDLPAGTHRLQVTPTGDATLVVIDANLTLEANQAYTVAATGLLGTNDLKPIVLHDDRRLDSRKAKVRFIHASPDAPAVDIAVIGGPVLFSNVSFREAGIYLSVDAGTYNLEVRVAGTTTIALTLPNVSLNAATNYSVFAIGLAGNGSLSALPAIDQGTAQVRVTHLSPDAPNVDIWVSGNRVLENVPYKAISNYLELPAGAYRVQVTPAGATSPIVIDATLTLDANVAYTVAATGLLNANDLKPIVLIDDRAPDAQKAKVRFVHTSPDAPAVDIAVAGGPVIFSNVSFREAGRYLSVDPGTYNLEVRLAGTTTVALTVSGVTLGVGTNYSVFAIGLVGNATLAALPATDNPLATGIEEPSNNTTPKNFELAQNYPNPFNPETKIAFTIRNNAYVKLVIYDMLGKEVTRLVDKTLQAGTYAITWDGRSANGLQVASGTYLYTLQTENLSQTRKMLYVR